MFPYFLEVSVSASWGSLVGPSIPLSAPPLPVTITAAVPAPCVLFLMIQIPGKTSFSSSRFLEVQRTDDWVTAHPGQPVSPELCTGTFCSSAVLIKFFLLHFFIPPFFLRVTPVLPDCLSVSQFLSLGSIFWTRRWKHRQLLSADTFLSNPQWCTIV